MGALHDLVDFLERVKKSKPGNKPADEVKADLDALTQQTKDVSQKIVCDVERVLDEPE